MPLHVLVADDIAASRQAACELVTALGHTALSASCGSEVLERVSAGGVDLVLLDLLMPDMDGFEVTRQLRLLESGNWLPVIVTSSWQGDDHFVLALEQGADDCLSRPLHAPLLKAKLRHYERVLALQDALRHSAARHQAILDNVLDPVVTLDDEGRVQDHNRAAARLCDAQGAGIQRGMPQERWTGEPWPEVRSKSQLELRGDQGLKLVVEPGWSSWQGEAGVQHTVVMHDVSKQQQVHRMQEEFLATVSHELRTPLTSLLGAIGLMAGGAAGDLPVRMKALVTLARRNGERLGSLIDDVLDLTKIEGDRLTLKLQSQAVLPLIQEAVAALQASVQAKDLKLQVEVAPLVEAVTLTLDAQRFQQVMSNLLSNAVKHSPQQGVVRVIVGMDGASVRITVRDQGPGVPPEFRDRLFSKFAQADGSDGRVHGGAGLGLYISHLLVDRMGGRIEIDAQEGEGASFSLRFPLASGGERRPVALLIDADVSSPDVLQELLGDRVQIVHSSVLPAAAEMAKAQLVLANPQGQGDADLFVATLRRKLGAKPIMLWGDCMDEEYAGRVGLPWLAGRREDRDALRAWARVSLAQQ